MKSFLVAVLGVVFAGLAVASDIPVKLNAVQGNGTITVPLKSAGSGLFTPTAISVYFASGSNSNTLTITYVSGSRRLVLAQGVNAGPHTTAIWYAPNIIWFHPSGSIEVRNTDAGTAVVEVHGAQAGR